MKKVALLVIISLMVVGIAFAETQKKVITQQVVAQEEIVAKKKAELNGTEWTVQMKPMTGKGKAETDVISFSEDKVSSKNLTTLGYEPSNFTVRLQEDGTVTWETMQTSEKDGIAFWRGDIQEGVMHGVLSKKDKKNNSYDFNFASTGSIAKAATTVTTSATTQ